MPERSTPGVAVVGAGYWGQNLVRNMSQLGRLVAICDASPAVRDRMQGLYPGVRVVGELDEVLEADDVAGVMLAVPSSQHHPLARRSLLAGKHTYVEKPISLTVSDGEDLVRLASDADRRLMVGHLLLYHPCVAWLRETLESGELGRVLYLNSVRVNLGKVRHDENAMWSLAPHDISVALHLLGGRTPTHVAAQGFCWLQPGTGIEDVVFLTLRFDDGVAAQIHVSWLDPHKKRQLTVVGSRKMVTFDDMVAEKVRVLDKGVDGVEQLDQAQPYESYADLLTLRRGDIRIPHIAMREPLRALCEDFLRAVDTGARPLTDGESGVEVLRVLQAGQQSLQTGGVPVALSPHPGGRRAATAGGSR